MPADNQDPIEQVIQHLISLEDKEIASRSLRFFKTGPDDEALSDQFLGIRMPQLRALVKQYKPLSLVQTIEILQSPWHEIRIFALLMLVELYKARKPDQKQAVYEAYLNNTRWINNWDLVDASAYHIVGPWLLDKDRAPLYQLAKSPNQWERRIAIVSTYHFIRQRDYSETLALAEVMLEDTEDLVQKSVGWMLKEVGKRNLDALEAFLQKNSQKMPRTMLRTAVEKLPREQRSHYLKS